MKLGVFDSGLGGLTIVQEITKSFKGADIFYIADTAYAPYGQKTQEQILFRCEEITKKLINEHKIDVLIIACNTATSAAVATLREMFKDLVIIGLEPGVKPASQISSKIGVLATTATLNGEKYKKLVKTLKEEKEFLLYEQACPGLVEQIEKGHINHEKTSLMLKQWLKPMKEKNIDTIVLGCTHYPLVKDLIKKHMFEELKLIETGEAISNRLKSLSLELGHKNEGKLNLNVFHTGKINLNMIELIFKDKKELINVRKYNI